MYRSPLHDIKVNTTTEDDNSNEQGMFYDFIDSAQRGFLEGIEGDAETVRQLTGYGEDARDFLGEWADEQVGQMSSEGQTSLDKDFFYKSDDGKSEVNGRRILNTFGQVIGTIGAFAATGGGATGVVKLGVKGGAKLLGKGVTKKVAKEAAAKKAAELGLKGKTKEFAINAGVSLAIGNGMAANGERDKYLNTKFEELQNSPAFSQIYWAMREDPDNGNFTDNQIAFSAREELAEQAATRAFQNPKLIAINAASGFAGVVGGSGLGIMKNVLKPATTAKKGLLKGMLVEGSQEASQGGIEQLVSNENYRDLVDIDFDVMTGVDSAALTEGFFGAVMGGATGAVSGYRNRAPMQAEELEGSTELPVDEDIIPTASEEIREQALKNNPERAAKIIEELDNGDGLTNPEFAQVLVDDITRVATEKPSPEQRATNSPMTGNHSLDSAINHLDDSKSNFVDELGAQVTTSRQLLDEAAKRQADLAIPDEVTQVNELSAEEQQPVPLREKLVDKGVLSQRNEFQDTLDLAKAYDPEKYAEIESLLVQDGISQDEITYLEQELSSMANKADDLGVDPLQTSLNRIQSENTKAMSERDNPSRVQSRAKERYDLANANNAAKENKISKAQVRENVIDSLLPEDRKNAKLIDRLVGSELRRMGDDGSLPKKAEYSPEPYADSGREFERDKAQEVIAQKEKNAENASLLAESEKELASREEAPEANPNWIDEENGQPVTRVYAREQSHLKKDERDVKIQGIKNRIENPVSDFGQRHNSMKMREQGKKPIQDFKGISSKTKSMSKRLRRRVQRAKGFDSAAVLEEFQNNEKRLQAYEQEVQEQAQREANDPENIQRRKSAEMLFAEKMESGEAAQFKENLITESMNVVDEIVESSAGTVLEIDGQQVSVPEVKRQLANGVRTLANKFIGKTAAMNERIRQKRVASEPEETTKTQEIEPVAEKEPLETEPSKEVKDTDKDKIDDFGETLHGARKHEWGKFGDVIHSDIESSKFKGMSLAELVPKPNLEKLHTQGVSKRNLALLTLIRGTIPSKGRYGIRLQKWVAAVSNARTAFKLVLDDPTKDPQLESIATDTGKMLLDLSDELDFKQIESLANFSLGKSPFNDNFIFVFKKDYRNKLEVKNVDEFQERALEFIQKQTSGETKKPKSKSNLSIYANRYDRTKVSIGLKVGSRVVDIQSGFSSYSEAADFLTENRELLDQKVIAARNEFSREVRTDNNRSRQGDNGRSIDVTPEMFANTFQFRGVQFGNWVEDKRRQQDLNDAYDALVDLSNITGIPPEALSLNGELGLAFGARGVGGSGAAAHYEPNQIVINLTKKNGKGSLAHEWFHALDNYFGKKNGHHSEWISENPRVEYSQIREELAGAFLDLRKAVDATGVSERSAERDKYKVKAYWDTTIEKLARSFESWIIEQNSLHGVTNDYLANVVPEDKVALESYPYPTKEELDNGLSYAFTKVFSLMKTSVDEGNGRSVLFSQDSISNQQYDKHISKKQAQLFVNSWLKGQKLNDVKVTVLATQAEAEAIVGGEVDNYINAFYTGDEIFVVAENIKDTRDLKRKLRHEVLTHYKLDKLMTDKEVYELLNLVHQTKDSQKLKHIWDHVEDIYGGETDYIKAEEAIAYANEFVSDSSVKAWLDKVTAVIAKVLRRLGLMHQSDITQAELNNIARVISAKSGGQPVMVPITVQMSYTPDSAVTDYYNNAIPAYSKQGQKSRVPGDVKVIKGTSIKAATIKEMRLKAKNKGFQLAGIYKNKDSGLDITVGRGGVKHTVSKGAFDDLLSSMAYLDQIIEDSKYLGSEPDVKNNANVKAHHYFGIKYEIDNKIHDVVVDVREMPDGKFYYDHSFEKEVSASGGNSSGPRLLPLEPDNNTSRVAEADTSNISQGGDKNNDRSETKTRFSQSNSASLDREAAIEVNGGKNPTLAIRVKQSKLMQAIKLAVTDNRIAEAVGRNKYALLTLRQIAEVGRYINKSIGTRIESYQGTIDEMNARKNDLLETAYKITDEFSAWAKQNQKAADKLFEFMHDSTLADVDPSKPFENRTEELLANIAKTARRIDGLKGVSDKTELRTSLFKEKKEWSDLLRREPQRHKEHIRLRNKWGTLTKKQRQRFKQARDHYVAETEQMNKALEENINRSVEDMKVRKEMLLKLRQRQEIASKGLYFPLARHGDYWVNYADKNGERQFEMFESRAAMEAAKARLEHEGINMDTLDSGMNMDETTFSNVNLPFVSDVVSKIRSTKMNDQTKDFLSDEIYQMYLRTLPQRSLRRNFIHRKGVAGFSQDAIRTMADNGFKFARQQSRLEYNDALDAQLAEITKEAKSIKHGAEASRLVDELTKRHEWVKNPKRSAVAQKLTGLGFSFLLGLSPAAALVNLTQNVQVAIPVIGSRHGFQAASHAMMRASKEFLQNARKETKGKGHMYASLSKQERTAMDEAIKAGAIDVSQAHDLLGLSENPNATYNATQHKVMNVVGGMFHKAEVMNREVTFMASYRLNMEKSNDQDAAIKQAIKDVTESHFDYASHNRARFMQGDLAAVALQFKQYSQQMTYYLASNLYKSLKGESPEVKTQARKQLVGTLLSTFAIGGVGALPLQMLVLPMQLASTVFGDDDEPFDVEVEMKRTLSDWVGDDVARHLWYGTVPSISNRISLNSLWFYDLRETDPDKKYMEMMKQAAGPVLGGVLFNTAQGMTDMTAGHHWRGLEKMMPTAFKNVSKTARYIHDEGVLTKNADVVVPWDDIDVLDLGKQAAGFTLADSSIQYDKNSAAYEYSSHITRRRQSLMNAYWSAYRLGDSEGIRELQKKIAKFNKSEWGSANPITQKSIKQSMKARERNQQRSIAGARINPKYHKLVEEYDYF